MALSPVKAYHRAAKQLETAYDDLTNFAKHGKMPDEQALYDRVFRPSMALENLYAQAAQGLEERELQQLAQSHIKLMKKCNLGDSPKAISHAQKTSSASRPQKTHSSSSTSKTHSTSHTQKTTSTSASHHISQPDNEDAYRALALMERLEDTKYPSSLQEIAGIYIAMTATSQLRGYKLLCIANGGVVNDVLTEGKVHLIKNPKSLLKTVTYHGQTMSVIDHLLVKAGGKPLCLDVVPHIPDAWESTVQVCTKEDIHVYLDKCLTMWCRNPEESRLTAEALENSNKEQRQLNQQIFCLVKAQAGIQTPMEFVGALQGHGGSEPRKVGEAALHFNPIEDQFYKLDQYQAKENKPPLKVPTEDYELVNETNHFEEAIKRTGNHLYLYLDGKSHSYILINGMLYPAVGPDRRGCKEPSYRFKEGDVVCSYGGTYLFTVGKNGTIHYPGNKKNLYPTSSNALQHSKQFALSLAMQIDCKNDEMNRNAYPNTTRPRAAEIDWPLPPGFSIQSTTKSTEKAAIEQAEEADYKKRGDLIFIDVPNDPVLKSLIAYLEKEFEVMQYTDAQKMMRIALLSTDLLRNDVPTSKFKGNNYLLGEIVRAGAGNATHRSALNKVLCDAFKINCVLINGLVDVKQLIVMHGTVVGHHTMASMWAWNIIQVDGHKYLVDSAKQIIFPLDNLPGTTSEAKKELKDFYGARD